MSQKHVVVTGAGRGIGLELCRQFSARGDRVTATCRTASAELRALPVRIIEDIDVCSAESVEQLQQQLSARDIDLLINNAGLLRHDHLGQLDFDEIERLFQVNAVGPLRVTQALVGSIVAGGKIGIITSRMGSIGDNTSGGYYAYRMSKAAVNIAGVSLARDLHDREIAVRLLHPGMVATAMTNGQGVPVADAATRLITQLDELTLASSGDFRHAEGYELPW